MAWEEIDVPAGQFIGWGTKEGQHVTGIVVDYDPTGATDFGGQPCPYLEVELTERAASFNKEGDRTDYDAGEIVQLSCGQVQLKKKIRKAEPKAGDKIKITLSELVKTQNGTVKGFSVQIDRSGGATQDDDEPPF